MTDSDDEEDLHAWAKEDYRHLSGGGVRRNIHTRTHARTHARVFRLLDVKKRRCSTEVKKSRQVCFAFLVLL